MSVEIPLVNGSRALVDPEDVSMLSACRWHVLKGNRGFYARTSMKVGDRWKTVLMHRMIVGAERWQIVDHINGNGLDNRRANLRLATPQQNARNAAARGSSGFIGVKRSGEKWVASISPEGCEIYLGAFGSAIDAAATYNAAASVLYGAFARLNAVPITGAEIEAVIAQKKKQVERLVNEISILKG